MSFDGLHLSRSGSGLVSSFVPSVCGGWGVAQKIT